MIDLLFIELGAVVAEVVTASSCTVEIYCDPKANPTYDPSQRVPIDFAYLLEDLIRDRDWLTVGVAAAQAQYDRLAGHGSPPIGTRWPGGIYEGVVTIRADRVAASKVLAAAVARHPGQPWEYHVVTSIDGSGNVTRYHGFHAEVTKVHSSTLELRVADAGKSAVPDHRVTELLYDPSDTKRFYAGELVADYLVHGGTSPRAGAVYLTPDAAAAAGLSLPKLPPGAGL